MNFNSNFFMIIFIKFKSNVEYSQDIGHRYIKFKIWHQKTLNDLKLCLLWNTDEKVSKMKIVRNEDQEYKISKNSSFMMYLCIIY